MTAQNKAEAGRALPKPCFGVLTLVVDSYLEVLIQNEVYQRIKNRVVEGLETTWW